MVMARKKSGSSKAGASKAAMAEEPEAKQPEPSKAAPAEPSKLQAQKVELAEEAHPAEHPGPVPPSKAVVADNKTNRLKTVAVAILALAVLALAYYYFALPGLTFVPGAEVSRESFAEILGNSTTVFVVIDLRGVQGDALRNSVMQCGIDFAGSTGIGDKEVIPLSLDSECFTPSGTKSISECTSMLDGGLTILIKGVPEGASPGASYYKNGMIVMVGSNYSMGGCSIKKV